ncbi:MAG TPA: Asp23/Gls24 family envelope stress response protein [Chloroflexota bacterium]|nr:Asp23/Gls24 family envelope stress response protein [Chloroflexota bacterium]
MADITGNVRIASAVLATVVNMTASSVPGVAAMGAVPVRGLLGRRRRDGTRGVRLRVSANRVRLDLYVVLAQGVDIVGTGAAIQRDVTRAVHEILGMEVTDVNVIVQKTE